jgi:hypothetical protein
MTKIRLIAATALLGIGAVFLQVSWAESKGDACVALSEARNALYWMLNARDKSALDELNAKVQAATAKLDSVLAAMTGSDAKVAADFKVVWDQFKATREKEIIPALYKGNAIDAKKIADGIQLGRLSRMWDIMSCKAGFGSSASK